jgi:hypothetical protein
MDSLSLAVNGKSFLNSLVDKTPSDFPFKKSLSSLAGNALFLSTSPHVHSHTGDRKVNGSFHIFHSRILAVMLLIEKSIGVMHVSASDN